MNASPPKIIHVTATATTRQDRTFATVLVATREMLPHQMDAKTSMSVGTAKLTSAMENALISLEVSIASATIVNSPWN
uniref:Uncharacterized protein n=1 Tax=Oryza nivara TaxID=4536 RepID=A0A0E0ID40_ORYNI